MPGRTWYRCLRLPAQVTRKVEATGKERWVEKPFLGQDVAWTWRYCGYSIGNWYMVLEGRKILFRQSSSISASEVEG